MYKVIIVTLLLFLLTACSGQDGESGANASSSAEMSGHQMNVAPATVTVKTPKVPFKFGVGMKKFRDMCSKCHGEWGEGSDQGPPLMHPFYKPSHHGDPAFYNAALKGVKAHHWKFGDMQPVEGATAKDVERILPFIRWLQKENGIY